MASELGPVLEALYKGERDRAGELAAEAEALNVFEAAALGDAERLRGAASQGLAAREGAES